MSPYLSPKNARAPISFASSMLVTVGRDAGVGDDVLVGEPLDLGEFFILDRVEMTEVEAQPTRFDERAGLVGVFTDHLSKRPMEKVGSGVGLPDPLATWGVDLQTGFLPDLHEAPGHFASMAVKALDGVLGVAQPR